jgi:hypothetical protein
LRGFRFDGWIEKAINIMITLGPLPAGARIPHLGAFESTKLMGTGTDILGTTRHIELWRSDLELLAGSSIKVLRYSVPWHRIEKELGVFDFSWFDQPMNFMREHGLSPIPGSSYFFSGLA